MSEALPTANPLSSGTGGAAGAPSKGPATASHQEKRTTQPQQSQQPPPDSRASGGQSSGHSGAPGGDKGPGMGLPPPSLSAKGKPLNGRLKTLAMSHLPMRSPLSGLSKGLEGGTRRTQAFQGAVLTLGVGQGCRCEPINCCAEARVEASRAAQASAFTFHSWQQGALKRPRQEPQECCCRRHTPSCHGEAFSRSSTGGHSCCVRGEQPRQPFGRGYAEQSPLTLRAPSPVTVLRAKLLEVHTALGTTPSELSASRKAQPSGSGTPREEEAAQGVADTARGAGAAGRSTMGSLTRSASTPWRATSIVGRGVCPLPTKCRAATGGQGRGRTCTQPIGLFASTQIGHW